MVDKLGVPCYYVHCTRVLQDCLRELAKKNVWYVCTVRIRVRPLFSTISSFRYTPYTFKVSCAIKRNAASA